MTLFGQHGCMNKRVPKMILSTFGAGLFLLLVWKGPWWADSGHMGPGLSPGVAAVVTGFRTVIVAVGAGVVAAIGLYYTDRNFRHSRDILTHVREKDSEQAELTREGQVIDRYSSAIKMLSADPTTEKLGGIYALERIMHDSPKYHSTIVEVLVAFIRANAQTGNVVQEGEIDERMPDHLSAAATVLGRRPDRDEPFRIDLRRAYLRGVDLKGAKLRRCRLGNSALEKADMRGIDLSGGWLGGASLKGAYMSSACLESAVLTKVDLTEVDLSKGSLPRADLRNSILRNAVLKTANLVNADLRDADLTGANLELADLSGADLRGAKFDGAILDRATIAGARLSPCYGLTMAQLTSTKGFDRAETPDNLE